jgi:hypothetical protein
MCINGKQGKVFSNITGKPMKSTPKHSHMPLVFFPYWHHQRRRNIKSLLSGLIPFYVLHPHQQAKT